MINIHHLIQNPTLYSQECIKRNKDPERVTLLIEQYQERKLLNQNIDTIRKQKNDFNKKLPQLSNEEKEEFLKTMKTLTIEQKVLEEKTQLLTQSIDKIIRTIPNLSSKHTPSGKSDNDNVQIEICNSKPVYSFRPLPYRELPIYKQYVGQEEGANAMGSRGYYMKGAIAKLQKVLIDYTLEYIMKQGYELMYVPLMLNQKVLTGTGHLPDFDGQQYETPINENTKYYLI